MDLSNYSLIFEEQFRQSEVQEVGKDWQHTLFWGARTIGNNGELQLYVDPKYRGLGLNPFRLTGDAVGIRARPATPKELPFLGGQRYVSGMITSERRFSAQYGYFEVRARLPAGRGLWPAVWLLPIDGTWPPEIDIVETVGHFGDTPDVPALIAGQPVERGMRAPELSNILGAAAAAALRAEETGVVKRRSFGRHDRLLRWTRTWTVLHGARDLEDQVRPGRD